MGLRCLWGRADWQPGQPHVHHRGDVTSLPYTTSHQPWSRWLSDLGLQHRHQALLHSARPGLWCKPEHWFRDNLLVTSPGCACFTDLIHGDLLYSQSTWGRVRPVLGRRVRPAGLPDPVAEQHYHCLEPPAASEPSVREPLYWEAGLRWVTSCSSAWGALRQCTGPGLERRPGLSLGSCLWTVLSCLMIVMLNFKKKKERMSH